MSQALKFHVETTDGNNYEVQAIFADLAKYDILRSRLNFPSREESQFLFMALVTYCALLRTGQVTAALKPEAFIETLVSIEPAEEAEEDEAEFRTGSES